MKKNWLFRVYGGWFYYPVIFWDFFINIFVKGSLFWPTFKRESYNRHSNAYYWVDNHPLPITISTCIYMKTLDVNLILPKSKSTFNSLCLNLKPKQQPTEFFQQTMVSAKLAPSAEIFCGAMLEMNVPGVTYVYERLISNMLSHQYCFYNPLLKGTCLAKPAGNDWKTCKWCIFPCLDVWGINPLKVT